MWVLIGIYLVASEVEKTGKPIVIQGILATSGLRTYKHINSPGFLWESQMEYFGRAQMVRLL